MRHEKILSRPDGSRVEIIAEIHTDLYRPPIWRVWSRYCAPGKRKFLGPTSPSHHASKEEELQAKLELWEKIKPV